LNQHNGDDAPQQKKKDKNMFKSVLFFSRLSLFHSFFIISVQFAERPEKAVPEPLSRSSQHALFRVLFVNALNLLFVLIFKLHT